MKVLITDEMHPALVTDLQHLGWQVDYRPDISNEETLQIISQYEILIISTKTIVDKNFITREAKRLKIVARGGSGMENIDSDYAQQKGIICFNTPEGNCNAVADNCIGLLLNLMNHISLDRQMRSCRVSGIESPIEERLSRENHRDYRFWTYGFYLSSEIAWF